MVYFSNELIGNPTLHISGLMQLIFKPIKLFSIIASLPIAVSGQQKDVLKPSKMRCKIKTSKF